MTTNKERIENLEVSLGKLQDGFSSMELGVMERLQQLETTINKVVDVVLNKEEASSAPSCTQNSGHSSHTSNTREEVKEISDGTRELFSSRLAKLEFPKYSDDDPTVWFNHVEQFFDYQGTTEEHKVSLASFHLEGEANQWWQWLHRAYKEEGSEVTWDIFKEKLRARFGPTDCEDFDEALSKIEQTGTLREYQKEFERLGNQVKGWTQKALVGTFMGGLDANIVDGIRMFKPKTLKEAIGLAQMKNNQIHRQMKANY